MGRIRNRFVHTEDLEYVLKMLVLQGEIFTLEHDVKFWKSLYDSIEAVEKLLESRMKPWKGTELEKPLKFLYKTTSSFIKEIKKEGFSHGSWCGASEECQHLLNQYRMNCIPNLLEMAEHLEENDKTRQEVEAYLLF